MNDFAEKMGTYKLPDNRRFQNKIQKCIRHINELVDMAHQLEWGKLEDDRPEEESISVQEQTVIVEDQQMPQKEPAGKADKPTEVTLVQRKPVPASTETSVSNLMAPSRFSQVDQPK